MTVLKKGMRPTKKKNCFQEQNETDVPNKKIFGGADEFCFTNMKIILQKCVPNKEFFTFVWLCCCR